MYPSGSDLQAYLVASGSIEANSNQSIDYDGFVQMAITAWERDTEWLPFLASDSTRVFDAPDGHLLDLGGGLIELTSLTLAGSTLTEGVDFDLFPNNAPAKGKPYTQVRFRYPRRSCDYEKNSLTIVGNFGYCEDLPTDVNLAILSMATVYSIGAVSGTTGTITQIKQDDISISYSSTNAATAHYSARQLQQSEIYNQAVTRYKRFRIF